MSPQLSTGTILQAAKEVQFVIQCPICQVLNEDNSLFCAECGQRFGQAGPPQQQSPQPAPQEAPESRPKGGVKLRSPMLGGGSDEDEGGYDKPQLGKLRGTGPKGPHNDADDPQKSTGRKHLRSPLLGGDDGDDDDEPDMSDTSRRAKKRGGEEPQGETGGHRKKKLRSPLLGEDDDDGEDFTPNASSKSKGKGGLRSPLLGADGSDFDDDDDDEPQPRSKKGLRSPMLDDSHGGGSHARGGGLRSPLLGGDFDDDDDDDEPTPRRGGGGGGATTAPGGKPKLRSALLGGGDYDEDLDDDWDEDDEGNPNVLRSPLLAAKRKRRPDHAIGEVPPGVQVHHPPEGAQAHPQPQQHPQDVRSFVDQAQQPQYHPPQGHPPQHQPAPMQQSGQQQPFPGPPEPQPWQGGAPPLPGAMPGAPALPGGPTTGPPQPYQGGLQPIPGQPMPGQPMPGQPWPQHGQPQPAGQAPSQTPPLPMEPSPQAPPWQNRMEGPAPNQAAPTPHVVPDIVDDNAEFELDGLPEPIQALKDMHGSKLEQARGPGPQPQPVPPQQPQPEPVSKPEPPAMESSAPPSGFRRGPSSLRTEPSEKDDEGSGDGLSGPKDRRQQRVERRKLPDRRFTNLIDEKGSGAQLPLDDDDDFGVSRRSSQPAANSGLATMMIAVGALALGFKIWYFIHVAGMWDLSKLPDFIAEQLFSGLAIVGLIVFALSSMKK